MLYCLKFFLQSGETQGVDLLAQEPNVGVVKEEFAELDRNIVLEEDIKQDAQPLEQVGQGLGSTDNIIHVGTGPGMDVPEDVIYLMLDVDCQIDIAYNWDLEGLLASVGDNGKHLAVIGMKQPLVKEGCNI